MKLCYKTECLTFPFQQHKIDLFYSISFYREEGFILNLFLAGGCDGWTCSNGNDCEQTETKVLDAKSGNQMAIE